MKQPPLIKSGPTRDPRELIDAAKIVAACIFIATIATIATTVASCSN